VAAAAGKNIDVYNSIGDHGNGGGTGGRPRWTRWCCTRGLGGCAMGLDGRAGDGGWVASLTMGCKRVVVTMVVDGSTAAAVVGVSGGGGKL